MKRLVLLCACLLSAAHAASLYAPVLPGRSLTFPQDFGSHDAFRTEWWYVTGWLKTSSAEALGFQITFFRTQPNVDTANPSAFTAKQILIAHCAISDVGRGSLWQDQRVRREGLGLVAAAANDLDVRIDGWTLKRDGERYVAKIGAQQFAIDLTFSATQPPLLNGDQGFSRKGPELSAASYYYSLPHLQVTGKVTRGTAISPVTGEAWLDHEWSSEYLDEKAVGWDWVGINFDNGAALMAFRIRDARGQARWAGGSYRDPQGSAHILAPEDIQFKALRTWQSPATGVRYPLDYQLSAGPLHLELVPLLDNQENDTRLTTGAIYWEGAVRALTGAEVIGRGYLELTGYGAPLSLR